MLPSLPVHRSLRHRNRIWRMQRARFLDASLTRTTWKADRWLCKEDPCSRHCCMCIIRAGHYTDLRSRVKSLLLSSFLFFSRVLRGFSFDYCWRASVWKTRLFWYTFLVFITLSYWHLLQVLFVTLSYWHLLVNIHLL